MSESAAFWRYCFDRSKGRPSLAVDANAALTFPFQRPVMACLICNFAVTYFGGDALNAGCSAEAIRSLHGSLGAEPEVGSDRPRRRGSKRAWSTGAKRKVRLASKHQKKRPQRGAVALRPLQLRRPTGDLGGGPIGCLPQYWKTQYGLIQAARMEKVPNTVS